MPLRPQSRTTSGACAALSAMTFAIGRRFIIVDGAEGGTAAAPLEYEDNVGLPLTDGLMIMHNALVGTGLRDRIRIGAAGKVASGNDIIKRLIQGADYTNAARSMMMAKLAETEQPYPPGQHWKYSNLGIAPTKRTAVIGSGDIIWHF